MKERFVEIGKSITGKVDTFFRRVLDVAPPYEEVLVNFTHGGACSKSRPLRKIEVEQYADLHAAGIYGIGTQIIVSQKYLECEECGSSFRYSV